MLSSAFWYAHGHCNAFMCKYNLGGACKQPWLWPPHTDSSVGRGSDSWSQGCWFYSHPGRSVVSLSKMLYPHCLILVKPRKAVPKWLKNCWLKQTIKQKHSFGLEKVSRAYLCLLLIKRSIFSHLQKNLHLLGLYASNTPIPLDGVSAMVRNFGQNDTKRDRNAKSAAETPRAQ